MKPCIPGLLRSLPCVRCNLLFQVRTLELHFHVVFASGWTTAEGIDAGSEAVRVLDLLTSYRSDVSQCGPISDRILTVLHEPCRMKQYRGKCPVERLAFRMLCQTLLRRNLCVKPTIMMAVRA